MCKTKVASRSEAVHRGGNVETQMGWVCALAAGNSRQLPPLEAGGAKHCGFRAQPEAPR